MIPGLCLTLTCCVSPDKLVNFSELQIGKMDVLPNLSLGASGRGCRQMVSRTEPKDQAWAAQCTPKSSLGGCRGGLREEGGRCHARYQEREEREQEGQGPGGRDIWTHEGPGAEDHRALKGASFAPSGRGGGGSQGGGGGAPADVQGPLSRGFPRPCLCFA